TTNPPPALQLFKNADKTVIDPAGESVTYSYTVVHNGAVPITGIGVMDDNGTPGVPGDDFPVGVIPSLAPGASADLTFTKFLTPPSQPIQMCANIDGGNVQVGQLFIDTSNPDFVKVTYVQQNVNDNRYGTGATAATG